jgi:putative sigma-54 modulation protein
MIQLNVSGNNYELTDKIREYVDDKIGKLERYLPKNSREGAHGNVTLTLDESGREDNQCVCEIEISAGGGHFEAREATLNMFAAIDIVEAKLKAQIGKFKDKHSPHQHRGQIFVDKLLRRHVPKD